ncbi:hypothetical protein AAFF_G00132470 [Aldrovandia affinis]|uniref:Uncharacterized protein n=1 Tax=Aldrovandia affinis TaxID=143900 RepID=A0AAD7RR02_9TELE|nr:hypothetical protein AAFF_G00132470 [Aldrovandia affinis]
MRTQFKFRHSGFELGAPHLRLNSPSPWAMLLERKSREREVSRGCWDPPEPWASRPVARQSLPPTPPNKSAQQQHKKDNRTKNVRPKPELTQNDGFQRKRGQS